MSVKVYAKDNYFFIEDPELSTPLSDHKSHVKVWLYSEGVYQIISP